MWWSEAEASMPVSLTLPWETSISSLMSLGVARVQVVTRGHS